MADQNLARMREILEAAATSTQAPRGRPNATNEQKIGDFYFSGMDTDRVEG